MNQDEMRMKETGDRISVEPMCEYLIRTSSRPTPRTVPAPSNQPQRPRISLLRRSQVAYPRGMSCFSTASRLLLLALFASSALNVLGTSSAEAKPRLKAPSVTRVGHGVVLKGSGFEKRSVVTLRIGPRGSETYFVERLRTDRFGRFKTVQRVRVIGDWVWVVHGRRGSGLRRKVMLRKPMKVRLGVSVFFEPRLGVTAGTPFYVHGHGWGSAAATIQARRGKSGRWRGVGRARASKGSLKLEVGGDNRVFNPRTRAGVWQIRVCTNRCRVGQAKTWLAEASFRIGEP